MSAVPTKRLVSSSAKPRRTSSSGWDDLTVRPAGGHVLQSRAWAEHRATRGWQPRYLVGDDGSAVLALIRPWPVVGGASAYLPRGPVPDRGRRRRDRPARWCNALARGRRASTWSPSDAEVVADGYAERLAIHRVRPDRGDPAVPPSSLGAASPEHPDEDKLLENISKSTRQRIRQAERGGLTIVRHDATPPTPRTAVAQPSPTSSSPTPSARSTPRWSASTTWRLQTADRRHFALGSRASFLDWTIRAYAAGFLVLLEAIDEAGLSIAGLMLYRHGRRLSTALSGDREDARKEHPGAFHLLRWRALQAAVQEGASELDLGGVDVAGARHEPREGESMFGLYQHKRSFGAEWLELPGAHERVLRPWRYTAGRVAARVMRGRGSSGERTWTAEAWDAYVRAHPKATYLQVEPWAHVKASTGWSQALVGDPSTPAGPVGARLLHRAMPVLPWRFAYAPRGPLANEWNEVTNAAWLESLRAAARPGGSLQRTAIVRMDPEIEAAAPIEAALRASGWRPAHDMQPRRTRIVDLTADEDALWSDLRKKWRQYVNKARSNGIVVRDVDPAVETTAFDTFYAVMREVSKRTALPLRSAATFREVWEAYAPTGESRLLFAEDGSGEVQAVLLTVRCGSRVVEPYGGMTEAGAESRANYLLKWEAIRSSKERGGTSYDMWGLIGSGIDHFKAGFGGREVEYIGAWDLALSPVGATAFRAAERGRQLYRAARRRLRGENLALPSGPASDA